MRLMPNPDPDDDRILPADVREQVIIRHACGHNQTHYSHPGYRFTRRQLRALRAAGATVICAACARRKSGR